MSIFREIPPTAGLPLHAKDLLALFKIRNYNSGLENDFRDFQDVPYAWITCSGTAGLYLICESLKSLSERKTVIIPSYICPSVALAIIRAGLKVLVCDINGSDFNFNLPELEKACTNNGDILAIVIAHLGGIPQDFEEIDRIAGKYGIFTIEDCAQSLGATYKERKTGALGDFSFFSLARGKGLTIYEGGVVVTRKKEHAAVIGEKIKELVREDSLSEALKAVELLGYGFFYRPRFFWFVYNLPEIFWGLRGQEAKAESEYFSIDFPLHKVSNIRKLIGHINFYRLEQEINKQRLKAAYYIERLSAVPGMKIIKEPAYARANYPFLTLIFDEQQKKQKILNRLLGLGRGASELYTMPVSDYDYVRKFLPEVSCSGAKHLASRQMILSTSNFLKQEDLEAVVRVIKKS
ncbi:MAG: DegT/DnrJ/EryC1/StrS family aminotransferase [Candidatus Omnitrophica bacterium]|nr:DegT/DnrJ/EryC1/StrS family aminotransferase [Candidatus Omnitrophota bacterium]